MLSLGSLSVIYTLELIIHIPLDSYVVLQNMRGYPPLHYGYHIQYAYITLKSILKVTSYALT